jgi:hypothetical protein
MEVGTLVPGNKRLLVKLMVRLVGPVAAVGTVINTGDQAGPVVATAPEPEPPDIVTVAPGVYPAPGFERVIPVTWPFAIVTDPTTAGMLGVLPEAGVIVTVRTSVLL